MGDWDYGREKGIWGNDGIPYSVKYERPSYSTSRKSSKTKRYNRSEQLAYDNGFKAIYDASAYNGRYFIKNGKKWIHNIQALKAQLGVRSDKALKSKGYDVDAYYASR